MYNKYHTRETNDDDESIMAQIGTDQHIGLAPFRGI